MLGQSTLTHFFQNESKGKSSQINKKKTSSTQQKGNYRKKQTNPTVHKLSSTTQNKTRMFALTNIFNIILEVLGRNYTKKKKKK